MSLKKQVITVQQIMTKKIVTVGFDDNLSTVKEIFDHLKFHHLLVVDSDELFGIVSDRDLLKALSPRIGTVLETPDDEATLNKKVHHIMSRKPLITLLPDATIIDAVDLFSKHNISCIPVVDNDYKPIGLVSWRDILKALVNQLEELEEI